MHLFKQLTIISISLLLTACADQITRHYQQGNTGYRITLNTALTISPEQARVFLQNGSILSGRPDEYVPHCGFEVRHLSSQPQTIQADDFTVSRVQNLAEEVVLLQPIQVATLGTIQLAADEDSSPSDILRGYHFWLRAEAQPDVIRMTCRGTLAEPWEALPPTLGEMIDALGDHATLHFGREAITPGKF